ncbi:MAG TPA: riboflavin synthase [Candidatus Kapabacteria bacterium]|jgi:riboflavin synthase
MFTGLIEELGTVVDQTSCGTSLCLKIKAERIFRSIAVENDFSAKMPQNGLKIGDSIAVNGICLTVENVEPPFFQVTAVEETLRKTTLGSLTIGRERTHHAQRMSDQVMSNHFMSDHAPINLERAATIETRLGGHLVQGHVDTTARLAAVREVNADDQSSNDRSSADSWEFAFEIPEEFAKYAIPKGSIAFDGISLTIAEVRPATSKQEHGSIVKVAIIPHTYTHTNLAFLNVGDPVNVEFDVIAKMVEQFVKPYVR